MSPVALLTTCPACHTRFRLTPEQLEAHGGDVRCGRCAKVFNANLYLEEVAEALPADVQPSLPFDAAPAEPPVPPAVAGEIPLTAFEDFVVEEVQMPAAPEEDAEAPLQMEDLAPDFVIEAEPAVDEAVAEPAPAEAVAEFQAVAPAPEQAAEPESLQPVEAAVVEAMPAQPRVVILPAVEEDAEESEEPPRRRRLLWLWLPLSLLLLITLAGQAVYSFRTELAARYPDSRPTLQQLCARLGCTVPLPANPDLLSIEASNLEADPNQANLVVLNAILRNRAKFPQEYPLFELTLTDTQDQMVARRIFPPAEYAKAADLKRGMPANEELVVKLSLDLGELKASGYRVFLFYPQ